MDFQGNNSPSRELLDDQYFLINFIMSNDLGPDVYSDNPRCSASKRSAQALPPYTLKNLGCSFISIPQLQSLYYYVLRNAHPTLVLNPTLFCVYLTGYLPLSNYIPHQKCPLQFPDIFPLNIHEHKKYSLSNEIVKGIVLTDNPDTSSMKEDDLERFRRLSGIDDLRIDNIISLCYPNGYLKQQHFIENVQNCEESAMVLKTCEQRQCSRNCESDHRPARMSLLRVPSVAKCVSDGSVVLTGTATMGMAGPPVGMVDIGESEAAYFFQVALPGVRKDYCEFGCEIQSEGKVHVQGSIYGGKMIKKRSRVFDMKFQQLCQPGRFTVSFSLPGRVDPRLFSPNFRPDGIFEAVVFKHGQHLMCSSVGCP